MRKHKDESAMNMTPMIDVVFQLIIFFIVTIAQQQNELEMQLRMAMAPDGKAVERKDPRTITVDVDTEGRIFIARQRLSLPALRSVLINSVNRHGQTLPVVIRGDLSARHEYIRRVVDTCSAAGLWRIKFAAIKEKA
jgi:biopolymer transport protein ExbD